jgi:hypothetical protein
MSNADSNLHPYKTAPDRAFWSRSVSRAFEPSQLLPGVPRLISRKDKVASAGSCFASNIVPYLEAAGLHYVREEQRHHSFCRLPPDNLGYDKFSAGYGNIYTVRQALQLLRRARGVWTPQEDRWHVGGEVVDPYRPGLKYRAANDTEFDLLTAQHLRAVLRAFESATVFVFTLGLTEAWTSTLDGAVFPACPGLVTGVYDGECHKFKNFTVGEVTSDLHAFVSELRQVNPTLRFILTVSPVPLVATATDHHVLLASTYSKSVLRVAAQQACLADADVHYFPAYEIITGPQAPASFFEADFRNVSTAGVDCVMSTLIAHCEVGEAGAEATAPAAQPSASADAQQALGMALANFECEEAAMDS